MGLGCKRGRCRFGVRALVICSAALALAPAAASADRYLVDATTDLPAGTCTSGSCSLREAILAANARPGADTVVLRGAQRYPLSLAGEGEDLGRLGDLDVTDALTISVRGSGKATLESFVGDRVLDLSADTRIERLRISGGVAPAADGGHGAAIRASGGRLTLRSSEISDNAGPSSAIALVAERGMTVRDSSIVGNIGDGIADLGGGGVRAANTALSDNSGHGVSNGGAGNGAVGLYHSSARRNTLSAVAEAGAGDLALVDVATAANGEHAAIEGDEGGLFVRRSRLRGGDGTALVEGGVGELSVYRSRLTGSRGGAAVEDGVGGIAFIKARIAFNGGPAMLERDEGSIGLEEADVVGSPSEGLIERGEGGISLTLASVSDTAGAAVVEEDEGDVTLTRGRVFDSDAAGLIADGEVGLFRSRIFDNAGGVVAGPGRLTLARTSIVRNKGPIGGIAVTGADVVVRRSTVAENAGDGDGGGILLSAGSSLDAANATIAANRAGGSGGGIFADATSELRLNAVTVATNAAAGPGGGGIMLANGASAIIDNSLLAANFAAAGGDDCDGSGFESGGGNLISKIAGCLGLGGSRDTVALRPGIERLGANGGPTSTVALRPSSPALGAAGADAPGRDQRNVRRRNPDAGAFERR